ncbi:MAG: NUDIX hydrolase [Spirosomataceae bacterium]
MNLRNDPYSATKKSRHITQVSIDCVIFGFHDQQLKVLVLKFKNADVFALPGGFIRQEEDIDTAARRILAERTGVTNIYLEQFATFGKVNRNNPELNRELLIKAGKPLREDHWLFQRTISIGYYALVDFTQVCPQVDDISDSCTWYDIQQVPPLFIDHREIMDKALETLRRDLPHQAVSSNLLPQQFTMHDLQVLYQTILGRPLVRTNFQRKMLSSGLLERIEKKYTGGAHRAPYLYRFKQVTRFVDEI